MAEKFFDQESGLSSNAIGSNDREVKEALDRTTVSFPEERKRLNPFKKIIASTLVAVSLSGAPVSTLAEGSNLSTTDNKETQITTLGEMPSQSEATPSPLPEAKPEVTPGYKASFKEQLQDPSIPIRTLKEMAENIFQDWKLKNYGPYIETAKQLGLTDKDEIWFTAKDLYTFENAPTLGPGVEKYQKYLTEQDIAMYALTGEDKDVIEYEDSPLCRLVMPNFTDKGKERLRKIVPEAINLLESEGINIVDSIKNGSAVVFYIDELQPETGFGAGLTGEWGVFNMNLSEANIKSISDETLTNRIAEILRTETFGIDCNQLSVSLELTGSSGFSILNLNKYSYMDTIKYDYIGEEFLATKDRSFVVFGEGLLERAEKNIKDYDLSPDLINRLGELVEVVFESSAGTN